MASQTIKLDIVLDAARVNELVPDYDHATDQQKLVDAVRAHMDLHTDAGGWMWKIAQRKDGTYRLIGNFVPTGLSVLA